MTWVEELRAVPQLSFFLLELREFRFPRDESPVITAPGKDSIGSGDRMSGEGSNDKESERRRCRATYQAKSL